VNAQPPAYLRGTVNLPNESCAAFVDHAAAQHGDRIALVRGDRSLSYRDLGALVARFRRRLTQAGLAEGHHLAIAMAISPQQIALTLAALQLGVIVVPIYDNAPAAELRSKCVVGGVHALAVDEGAADRRRADLAGVSPQPFLLPIDADLHGDAGIASPIGAADPDGLAATPFSSGSTGEPKLILLSHRNVLASRLLFADATRLVASSVLVHFLPLSHVYGWMALTAALGAGAKVILHDRYDFDRLIADIEQHQANAGFAVSQTIIDLDRAGPDTARRLASLRWLNTGAAPMAPATIAAVARRFGLTITTGYGLTEAAPVAHTPVERVELVDVATVGFPVANTVVQVVDPDDPQRPMRPGMPGELAVVGPQVARGYRLADGRIDRTSWLADGALRTGDLVEFDAAGRLRIVGRIKNIIKYKGYSVAPAELEAILAGHPGIRDCVVLGKPDHEAGEIPVAFAVTRGEPAPSPDELIAFMRSQVAPQRCVRQVVLVDAIPRSGAGKVMSTELLARL